jgi:alpha-tubulin suppressor-like RCC1 family protein
VDKEVVTERGSALSVATLLLALCAACGDGTGPSLGLLATSVAAGRHHTCAIAPDGAAQCWGARHVGQLGDGVADASSTHRPVPVTGGLTFTVLESGLYHTCGVTAAGAAYCWGRNDFGQLGTSTSTSACQDSPCAAAPMPVEGGLRFRSVTGGFGHSCGVTTDRKAYCWGWNDRGQLGNGTRSNSAAPVPVSGSLAFTSVEAGPLHTCGTTADGSAYCWGLDEGRLGRGDAIEMCDGSPCSTTPAPVSGGLRFSSVSAGSDHTCGLATGARAYCWGQNIVGQLGDGTITPHSKPVAVAGGLMFIALSAGAQHTCGLTTAGVAYCWGGNDVAELGSGSAGPTPCIGGTRPCSPTPVPVVGGLVFVSLRTGGFHSCSVTRANEVYCWGSNAYGKLGNTASEACPKPGLDAEGTCSAQPVRVVEP